MKESQDIQLEIFREDKINKEKSWIRDYFLKYVLWMEFNWKQQPQFILMYAISYTSKPGFCLALLTSELNDWQKFDNSI